MNKSQIFHEAHSTAKATVKLVGNYMIAFSIALKGVYKQLRKETRAERQFAHAIADDMIDVVKSVKTDGSNSWTFLLDGVEFAKASFVESSGNLSNFLISCYKESRIVSKAIIMHIQDCFE